MLCFEIGTKRRWDFICGASDEPGKMGFTACSIQFEEQACIAYDDMSQKIPSRILRFPVLYLRIEPVYVNLM